MAPSGTDFAPGVTAGSASLAFGVRDGRTLLLQSRVKPPLLVQRALYLDDALPGMAFVFLANPTAGVLEGDELTIKAELGLAAQAHLCTQAATKVFSMPNPHGPGGSQKTSLTLQEGAYLEYMPDAIIPFHNARFSQETVITMAPGATLVLGTLCHRAG